MGGNEFSFVENVQALPSRHTPKEVASPWALMDGSHERLSTASRAHTAREEFPPTRGGCEPHFAVMRKSAATSSDVRSSTLQQGRRLHRAVPAHSVASVRELCEGALPGRSVAGGRGSRLRSREVVSDRLAVDRRDDIINFEKSASSHERRHRRHYDTIQLTRHAQAVTQAAVTQLGVYKRYVCDARVPAARVLE